MKIIFMGTPDFAVPSLEKLEKDPQIDVLGVVTQPDRRQGRGQRVYPSPIKKIALDLGLEIFQPESVNSPEFMQILNKLKPDSIVVVAFGQKLGEGILSLPRYGCINLHASLLPKYRGASPIHRAIIDGLKFTGVTTMYMAQGWDTGDLIYQKKIEIKRTDTVGHLHDKLSQLGADLLLKTLLNLKKGNAPRIKQDHKKATYAYKLNKDVGCIDWGNSAEEVFNLVRGLNPWPGAYTFYDEQLVKIWQLELVDIKVKETENAKLGEIVIADQKKGIVVKTGQGLIKIKELQLAGKRKMSAKDFLRGHNINIGKRFNKGV